MLSIFLTAPPLENISLLNNWRDHGPVDLTRVTIPVSRDIRTSSSPNLIFEGQVNQQQQWDGLVRRIWLKGDGEYEIYEGKMRNGQANGYGRRIRSDGSIYEGEWLNGSTMDLVKLGQELIVCEQIY